MADTLTFYRSRFSRQWRWLYQAEGNNARLANGGESYTKLSDAVTSAFRICALGPSEDFNDVNQVFVTRLDGSQVDVRIRR